MRQDAHRFPEAPKFAFWPRAKLARMDRRRLAQECAKLDPIEEQTIADEGIATDAETWPEY
jgi:hypothetical protein